MKTAEIAAFSGVAALLATILAANASAADRVKTANGIVEGAGLQKSGVRIFRGIPFGAPPVGDLRWKAPQPVASWEGVRPAAQFGPRCMQLPIFGDMNFRASGTSEDCLYLNVWTPAKSAQERLPVLVYFYGGGFQAGDGSEPRYDGESMATKGIVALTVNYRLGVFGFFSHPALTQESPHKASGNYAFLDQNAALRWVQENIAAFGGDPKRVTIAGESAGSASVSAQMASPLSKGLFAGAIGESGAIMGRTLAARPLTETETEGAQFAAQLEAASLAALRAIPAQKLLEASGKGNPFRFSTNLDGYFLPKLPEAIFVAGEQAQVPLLAGWNSEEMNYRMFLGPNEPTPENYAKAVRALYGEQGDEALRLYPGASAAQVLDSATDLAGDRFIAFSTWKWIDTHVRTSGQRTYRYYYARPRPAMRPEMGDAVAGLAGGVVRGPAAKAAAPPPARGAVHSAEIEYAMGNLATNKVYAWTADDYEVSKTMQAYFANFVKTGDPNGPGLPPWPAVVAGRPAEVLRIDVTTKAEPEGHRERYLFLDRQPSK
jgi:para-nitrobenzyl esterase